MPINFPTYRSTIKEFDRPALPLPKHFAVGTIQAQKRHQSKLLKHGNSDPVMVQRYSKSIDFSP
jgi:hypothetical protein